jgi:hypothetical protein
VVKRSDRLVMYRTYAKDGDKQGEMVIAAPCDIVSELPARISLKYGWLELGDYREGAEQTA